MFFLYRARNLTFRWLYFSGFRICFHTVKVPKDIVKLDGYFGGKLLFPLDGPQSRAPVPLSESRQLLHLHCISSILVVVNGLFMMALAFLGILNRLSKETSYWLIFRLLYHKRLI